MLADVYLVMCHDNFKLVSMPRTLHSLPVGAHFLERVFVTHIKYYCINTEPKCTWHLTVLTTLWSASKVFVTYYGHWVFSLQSRSEHWLPIWWHFQSITMLLRHKPIFFSCLPAMCLPDGSHFASQLCRPLIRPISLVIYV